MVQLSGQPKGLTKGRRRRAKSVTRDLKQTPPQMVHFLGAAFLIRETIALASTISSV